MTMGIVFLAIAWALSIWIACSIGVSYGKAQQVQHTPTQPNGER